MKKMRLIGMLIFIFLILTVPAIAGSYQGIPYLCPKGINEDNIRADIAAEFPQTLFDDARCQQEFKMSCKEQHDRFIDSAVENKISQLQERINDCNDRFSQIQKFLFDKDWSSEWTPEMDDFYHGLGVDSGTNLLISCFSKEDSLIENYDYYGDACLEEFDDDELNKALKAEEWNKEFCGSLKEFHELIEKSEKDYSTCMDSCEEKHPASQMYDCTEYNYFFYDEDYCPEIFSDEEYESVRDELWSCQDDCSAKYFEKKEAKDYLKENCETMEGFYSYYYFYNLYSYFYGSDYSGEDPSFFVLLPEAIFVSDPDPLTGTECPEDYELKDGICVLKTGKEGVFSLSLDNQVLDLSKQDNLTGKITYSCSGDCTGAFPYVRVSSPENDLKFEIKITGPSFLDKNHKTTDFVLIPKLTGPAWLYQKEASAVVKVGNDEKRFNIIFKAVDEIILKKQFSEPVEQGDTVSFTASINGPENYDYTYTLTSALDPTFYYGGKEWPIIAIIYSKDNSIDFKWKTPTISRTVNAKEFYLDELGQLSMESLTSVSSSIMETLTAGLLSHGFRGREKLIDKGIGTANAINDWSATDPVPNAISMISLLKENPIVGLGGSLTYSTYQAYKRATDRFNAFNSDKTHIYDVPLTVKIKPKGYPEITKTVKVGVEAPEAILK